jgi:hypothetical protein
LIFYLSGCDRDDDDDDDDDDDVLSGCDGGVLGDDDVDDDVLSGWTTSRHVNYPTADIPMNEIQGGRMLPWFKAVLRTRLLPWAASCFPAIGHSGGGVCGGCGGGRFEGAK